MSVLDFFVQNAVFPETTNTKYKSARPARDCVAAEPPVKLSLIILLRFVFLHLLVAHLKNLGASKVPSSSAVGCAWRLRIDRQPSKELHSSSDSWYLRRPKATWKQ